MDDSNYPPYPDSRAYLREFCVHLALRLERMVRVDRVLHGPGVDEAFLGLFLSEAEIDRQLASLAARQSLSAGQDSGIPVEPAPELEAEAACWEERIRRRLQATQKPLRPQRLAEIYGLSPVQVQALLLLLAPEVDGRFGRAYAYLQDDVSRRWLSPGLALRLLGFDPDDPAGRALFTPGSVLLSDHLVRLAGEPGIAPNDSPPPLLERRLKLDDRITEYLLEHDPPEAALIGWTQWIEQPAGLYGLALDERVRTQFETLAALWEAPAGRQIGLLLAGAAGVGKTRFAQALANQLGLSLLQLDGTALAQQPQETWGDLLSLAQREARLRGALLYLRRADALLEPPGRILMGEMGTAVGGWDERVGLQTLQRALTTPNGGIASVVEAPPAQTLQPLPLVIHFPQPGADLRRKVWQAALDVNGHTPLHHAYLNGQNVVDAQAVSELAERFRLTHGQILQAARAAQQRARLRGGPKARPTRQELFECCRQQSGGTLSRLAVKIVSPYDWDDLVLPELPLGLLHAIQAQVRYAHTVFEEWGFGDRLASGKGLSVLFSGPSGTGKTMAAGILSRSLGLDLYKIDLSRVVSKYIGETEKNLSRIFDEARSANAILFFDEADALFGKRSEVKDAHDRYANIEISYLLQKMEEYEGVTIMATNFSQNIDEAFQRRMQFVVEFPFPQADDRERIWRRLFPARAPQQEIDFSFLAGQFELTGGNIKNCVLAAAFLAAEEGTPIDMSHLIQGIMRELVKLGRPVTRASFGEYYAQGRRKRRPA